MTLGGKTVRVEVNFNSLGSFLKYIGKDSFDELSHVGVMAVSETTALMAATIAEGERLEGREFNMSPLDIGAIIRMKDVKDFMDIYVRQSAAQVEVDGEKKEEGESQES